jgi:hypothetical protein
VNVSGDNGKVGILIYEDAFITALIEMAYASMAPVEVPRVADIKLPHEFTEVSQGSFEQKMEMVAHEDITVKLNGIGT